MTNFEARRKLSELIEKSTKVKDATVNSISEDALKKLKEILKDNNENVKSFFDLLMIQLQAKNSHTRFLTVLLLDYIFTRSKYFRELLVKDMKPFFDLAVGTESDKPLPAEPAGWATSLREKSLESIEKWNTSFGQLYKQLRNGYNYLKVTRKMKFPDLQAAERRREEQERSRQERTQRILQVKFEKLEKEFEEKMPEIEQNLKLMDNSFKLLVPNLGIAEVTESEETTNDGDESINDIVQQHGLGSNNYEITISISKTPNVLKEENDALIYTLQDCLKVLNNQMRQVKDWSKVLVKLRSTEQANQELQETLLKRVIDIQNEMKIAQEKCDELKIQEYDLNRSVNKSLNRSSFDDGDDAEVEFEDGAVYEDNEGNQMVLVPRKEGYEEFHPDEEFDDFPLTNTSTMSTTSTTTTTTSKEEELPSNLTDALSRDFYYTTSTTPPKAQAKSRLSNSNNNNNNNNNNNTSNNNNNNNNNNNDNDAPKIIEDDSNTYQPHFAKRSSTGDALQEELKEDETKTDMLKRAPVMKNEPFLYFWGKSEIDLNTGMECNHRFLGSSKADTVVSTDRLGSDMFLRTAYYEPKQVEHKPCGAPKKDGTLCARRDAKFCPFHGAIIPRDEKGNPLPDPSEQQSQKATTTTKLDASSDQVESELLGSDANIQLPLFGTGTEAGPQQVERKKRKSEVGLRERMRDKATPKKQGRISL